MTRRRDPEKLADRLHSAAIHLLRRLRRVDDAIGLGAPQLSALSVVVMGGPIAVGELAAAEQVRPPTISRIVAQLEAEGLVTREREARDRRVVRVCATPAGRAVLAAGRGRRVAALAERLEAVGPGDLAALEKAVAILEGLWSTDERAPVRAASKLNERAE